jgi:hypothetical protein
VSVYKSPYQYFHLIVYFVPLVALHIASFIPVTLRSASSTTIYVLIAVVDNIMCFCVFQKVLCGLGVFGYGELKREQTPVFGDSIRSLFELAWKGPLMGYSDQQARTLPMLASLESHSGCNRRARLEEPTFIAIDVFGRKAC